MNDRLPMRFWDKVRQQDDGCWMWTAARNGNGYGAFTVRRKNQPAHRVAYEALVGPVPDGKVLHHTCEVKLCVNPAHLEPLTHRENFLRTSTHQATINSAKTHCLHGHEFTPDNILWSWSRPGGRSCRTCHNIRRRARRVASVSETAGA